MTEVTIKPVYAPREHQKWILVGIPYQTSRKTEKKLFVKKEGFIFNAQEINKPYTDVAVISGVSWAYA